MTVYTRRVAIGNFTAPGGHLLYTHAGPNVLVLRDIVLSNDHTAAQLLSCTVLSGSTAFVLFKGKDTPSDTSVHIDLRQELLAGDQLYVSNGLGAASVTVTGYFLSP